MTIKIIISSVFIFSLLLIPRLIFASESTNQAAHQVDSKLAREKQTMESNNRPLPACPDKPNCINSEYPDDATHYLPPLDFPDSIKEQIMPLAKSIIMDIGGTITKENIQEENKYLAATFTSSLFRFVDDFELRQDNISHKLHIRSASRTGYSDFSVNKRRIMKFSEQFKNQINNLPTRAIEK